ncbi:MAG: leucine-rich repeat protein, partial [Anaerobutyricum hallii]
MGKIKKIFCILLSICLAYSVNVNVLATEIKNQGKKFLNSSKEIEIDSAEDLLSMSNDLTATYTLVKNIDLKGKKWNPIGDNKKPFKGTFKGNGYKIFNFKINEKKEDNITDIGFFGVVENARISQLALENVSIYIKKNKKCSIGILAGKINQSQIANCFVKGSIKADISDNSDFGGIGGKALAVSKTNCSIKQCVLDVKIVNIRKKQLQKADVIGNVKNNCVIKNNYVYGQDSDKRRNEIQGNRILKKEERFKKENYNGFDFKNIWEITNKGIHLLKSVKKMESNNTKGKQETATLSTTEIKSAEVTKKARQKNVVAMQENLCGEYATYQIENGVLTISGKGKIDDNVFANDTGINSVIIEEGITEIGIRSFNNCSNLTEVKLPESLTTLGGLAFGNCQGLTSIKIPAGVKEVKEEWSNGGDRGPFYNCKNIKSAVLEKGMERIENRLLQDCTGLESVEIPEGIKEIGNYAFLNCSSLKEVKLPESLTTIGELAFGDCIGLTSIKIPAGVEEVKEGWSNGGNRGPFYNCKNIKSAVLEKGME